MDSIINYTVIIPHKNCPDLLERCVDSIPIRNDIQVVVVDDNSDNVEKIKELESKYHNRNILFVYTKDGKGAGFARNQGLNMAKGKWLLFSDSDDFFAENAFSCFDEYLDSEYDIVFFKHQGIDSETLAPLERSGLRNEFVENFVNSHLLYWENKLRYNNDVPWAKMVRHAIVLEEKIKFDEVPASNDTMFSVYCGYYAKSIAADNRIAYVAVTRFGSISKTKNKERYWSSFKENVLHNEFVKKIGHAENQGFLFSRWLQCLFNFGLTDFFRYYKFAASHNVNIFTGANSYFSPRELLRHFKTYFTKDKYMKK